MTAPAHAVSRHVDVGRLRLHYLEWNPDGPEPVVLLHGINVQAHTWEPIGEALARHRRVIAVDLRGHGDSDWSRDGYPLESFVADVVGLLGLLHVDRFDLIGHSLGGRIAIAIAGENPDRVSRLILSDTGPEMARGGGRFSRSIVSTTGDVRGFTTTADVLAHYRRLHPEWQEIFLHLHADHQVRRNWAGKLVFKSDPELFWLTGSAGAKENPYLWRVSERITCPVLVMWGTRSEFLDEDLARRMLAAMPRAELCRIESGHYIPREAPEQFIAAVEEFLDRSAAAAGGLTADSTGSEWP